MATIRIGLAQLPPAAQRDEAVASAASAIDEAGRAGVALLAFPECYVPGYRAPGAPVAAPDAAWLDAAWTRIDDAARRGRVAVVLGTERLAGDRLLATARVTGADGTLLGWQDKVQVAPEEERTYAPGIGRRLFTVGACTFGIAICHEAWRYPETVRWAARRGAQLMVHPQFHAGTPGTPSPATFADPAGSFHEAATRVRAAENGIWFATCNVASPGAPTTSAVLGPDGDVLAWQPHGLEGLLVAELDLALASGLLARRCRTEP
ncbi:MAG: carbon-nitrogen hydrolase family protein [Gemmatimonadales bacterium]|nr:carbon-nitrogen hydrolase family protein [Gemmatimonadales bacterium]